MGLFDYAWGFSPAFVGTLRANGAQFVCRYLSDPGGKGISGSEARELLAAGIIICPNWEVTGQDFSGGYNAGASDGRAAAAALRGLGAPAGTLCWFSIDTDTSDFQATNNYLRGAKSATGTYIAQLYGSDAVCDAAAAAGLGSSHWQTIAWSGGRVSQHAALYQYAVNVTVGGVSVDRNKTLHDLAGPWAHTGAAPSPPAGDVTVPDNDGRTAGNARAHLQIARLIPVSPAGQQPSMIVTATSPAKNSAVRPGSDVTVSAAAPPVLRAPASGMWVALAQIALDRAGAGLATDGVLGPATAAAVSHFQGGHGLAADGVIGPATWAVLGSL